MEMFWGAVDALNNTLLSVPMLIGLLCVGLLFTLWSRFCQYRSLTHGIALCAGKGIDTSHGPGALTHFQALSAAMSGTVGLGAIAGMALAIDFGGPGAVFWMWVVGIVGMALKTTEVTQALLFRDTSDPDDPHGGTMFTARNGLASLGARWRPVGKVVGVAFCLAMLLFAVTGGNMFQTWSVADTTREYFGVPQWITGVVLAAATGVVILGGIRRVGSVVDKLVPLMCGLYVLGGLVVLFANADALPDMFRAIFRGAFSETEGAGAFAGGLMGNAFMWGMKRALFSSEAGLGTAPTAHSAVKTPEPVTEGVVAGLEPFIDTIFVCTVSGLAILSSGVWQRGPAHEWQTPPAMVEAAPGQWQPELVLSREATPAELRDRVAPVFVMADVAGQRTRIYGTTQPGTDATRFSWTPIAAAAMPAFAEPGVFADYRGSTLAAKAFDSVHDGMGRWLVTITIWLFALSTLITYGYYGEKGLVFLGGARYIKPYRWVWCFIAASATFGFIDTSVQLDAISTVGMGFMYAINLPLMLILGHKAMRAYHDYFRRLKAGEIARPA
jgi:AGCS family alanine or glycine:cation symporter